MTNSSNVPKLRFPGFEGEWKEKKLKNISSHPMYGMNASAKEYDGKNIYLRITDINESDGSLKMDKLSSPNAQLDDMYKVRNGDLLFARTGASVGKTFLYKDIGKDLYFAGFLIKFHIDKANPYFVYLLTQKNNYLKWVKSISMRSGQPGINASEYSNFSFMSPDINEQKKIAEFLGKVDEWLENLKNQKENLEQYKKGMTQKIFSQKIRFKNENGKEFEKWKGERLGNLLEETDNKTKTNNQCPVLSSTKNQICLQSEYFNKAIASKDNIGYKILNKNELVFSPQNLWLGNINIYNGDITGIVSPSYKVYKILDKILVNYLKNIIKTPRMLYEYVISSEQGASVVRRNLNIDLFNTIKIFLPSLPEQQKIVDFLTSFDKLIDSKQEQIAKVEEWKKGLMQRMFI